MPGNTLEAIRKVAASRPKSRILAFTASQSIDTAVAVLEAGAAGYALKGISLDELAEAITRVHGGEAYITPSFAAKVVMALRENASRQREQRIVFSRREEQVLRLLLNGCTNREIAEAMRISEKTVKHYMSMLMQKLNARNRLEVVLAAQSLEGLGAGRGTAIN
jgi:DNA-binding NarL/FixJ family response regulator